MLSKRKLRDIRVNYQLYLFVALPVAYIIIFKYIPMYGAQIAFRRFAPGLGIWESEWVGLRYFVRFLRSYKFEQVMVNTLLINLYALVAGFPIPILLAILIHYCPAPRFKRMVQMVTYAPHFISVVVMVGIIFKMLAVHNGIANSALGFFGIGPINFLGSANAFPHVFVWSGIWQNMGWGTIVYLAALSSIDPELHESAKVDGASIWRRIWHIDIPGIFPTVVILLILRTGQMLNIGFEKVLLMQNTLNIRRSEVIQTYVYKIGLAAGNPNFSYAAAIGLFISLISFVLLIIVNRVSRRISETSLW